MATTTKKQLASQVSRHTGCKTTLAIQMVDTVFIAMRESLIGGRRIEIRGFGVFQVKETRAKPAARNPRTGEEVRIPPGRTIRFKPGKELQHIEG